MIFLARESCFLSVEPLFPYCGKTEVMAPLLELSGWDTFNLLAIWSLEMNGTGRYLSIIHRKPRWAVAYFPQNQYSENLCPRTTIVRESPITWRMTTLICCLRRCLTIATSIGILTKSPYSGIFYCFLFLFSIITFLFLLTLRGYEENIGTWGQSFIPWQIEKSEDREMEGTCY